MASMTLLSDGLMGNPAYFMTSATTTLNTTPHIYSSSSSSPPSSLPSPPAVPIQRIAPKLPSSQHHQQQQHKYHCEDLLRCKRRIQLGQLPTAGKSISHPQPAAVARRNERERNRVRLVNHGFATLRQHVPNSTKNKKMSKVDTLKSAVEYIKRLQELLGETGMSSSSANSSPRSPDENSYTVGQSSTGSPTPSLCSEASSPYDVMHGEQEEDLMDFAAWF